MKNLLPVLIAAFGFCLEAWPRLKNRYFGDDTWRYLYVAEQVRRKYPFREIGREFLFPQQNDLPPVLIYLLAVFPKKTAEKFNWAFSPVLDAVNSLMVFFISMHFTGNYSIALISQAVYMLSPLNVLEASNLSLRIIGSLFFNVSFFFLSLQYVSPDWAWIALSLVFFILLVFTHRMATQVYVLLTLVISASTGRWYYFGVSIAGLVLSILVSRGFYLTMVRGQIYNIIAWWRNIDNRAAHPIRGLVKETHELYKSIIRLVNRIPVLPLIPTNLFFLVLAYYRFKTFPAGDIYDAFYLWAAWLFVLGVTISDVKFLRCIGEGMRYLEYAAMPVALIAGPCIYGLLISGQFGYAAAAAGIVLFNLALIFYLQIKMVVNDRIHSLNPEIRELIDVLNNVADKEKPVVFNVFPMGLSPVVNYFTRDNIQPFIPFFLTAMPEFYHYMPFYKRPVWDTVEKYGTEYFIIDTEYVTVEELKLKQWETVRKAGRYVLIRTPK